MSDFSSAHLGWKPWFSLRFTQQIARELLDASAPSFQGLGKDRPNALNLLLGFLMKRSRFQRHLQLPAWQCSPCSIITRLQTNVLFPQNTVDDRKVLREGTREHGREEQIPPVTSQYALESFQAYHSNEIPEDSSCHGGQPPRAGCHLLLSRDGPQQCWWPRGRRGGGCSPAGWHELGPGCEHYVHAGEKSFLVN